MLCNVRIAYNIGIIYIGIDGLSNVVKTLQLHFEIQIMLSREIPTSSHNLRL